MKYRLREAKIYFAETEVTNPRLINLKEGAIILKAKLKGSLFGRRLSKLYIAYLEPIE